MANEKEYVDFMGRTNGGVDEYGVWVKSAPQDVPEEEKTEAEDTAREGGFYEEGEFVSLASLTEFDSAAGKEAVETAGKSSPVTAVETESDAEAAVSLEEAAAGESVFEEFAGEESFTEEPSAHKEAAPAPAGETAFEETANDDLPTQILKKIARELSSIRLELANLKREFAVDKAAAESSGGFPSAAADDDKTFLTEDEIDRLLAAAPASTGEDALLEETVLEKAAPEAGGFEDSAVEEPTVEETAAEKSESFETFVFEEPAGAVPFEEPLAGEENGFEDTAVEETAADEAVIEEPAPFEESAPDGESTKDGGLEDFAVEEAAGKKVAAEEPAPLEESPDDLENIEGFDLDIDFELPPEIQDEDEGTASDEPELLAFEKTAETAEENASDGSTTGEADGTEQIARDDGGPLAAASDSGEADVLTKDESPFAEEVEEPEEVLELENSGFEELLPDIDEADTDEAAAIAEEPADNLLDESAFEDFSLDLDMEEERLPAENEETETAADIPPEDEVVMDDEPFPDAAVDEEAVEAEKTGESADVLIPERFADETEAAREPAPEPALPAAEPAVSPAVEDVPEEPADTKLAEPPSLSDIPIPLKQELRTVLSYMDRLLESLPEKKIEEFARSSYFDSYKKLFTELGLI